MREEVTIPALPPRRAESHKGDFGRVLVLAGRRGMSGAAILSGIAALRGGAGLVTVACPLDIQDIVAGAFPCYMTLGLPCDDDGAITDLRERGCARTNHGAQKRAGKVADVRAGIEQSYRYMRQFV